MVFTNLLIQAVSGAIAGNVGGLVNKAKGLGLPLNTFAGAVGGIGGGQLLGSFLARQFGHARAWSLITSAVVGLVLPRLVGVLSKKTA